MATNSFMLILYAILGIFAWVGIAGLFDILLNRLDPLRKHRFLFYVILSSVSLFVLFTANELKAI